MCVAKSIVPAAVKYMVVTFETNLMVQTSIEIDASSVILATQYAFHTEFDHKAADTCVPK